MTSVRSTLGSALRRLSDTARAPLLRLCLLLTGMVFTHTVSAQYEDDFFIEASAIPGGIAIVDVPRDASPVTSASWNERKIALIRHDGAQQALVGIPLSTSPGEHSLSLVRADGRRESQTFTVGEHAYDEQRLTISNQRQVNPAPLDMERIKRENTRLKVVKSYRADRLLADSFDWPVGGPISSPFGLRRFFNDQPRRPHGGIDIAAAEGTRIRAPANGVVIETGDYFFNGNSVFIEHGLGLQTFYAHLSRIDVEAGQRISQGEVIGLVGQTGRVTGPHLHWSVGLNGTWVDPLLLLDRDTPPPARTPVR